MIDFRTGGSAFHAMDVRWIHGSPSAKHNTDPDIQVYGYDDHTFILRQNMAIDYEAPFMFLLFGNHQAVLIDTGATAPVDLFPLRPVVDQLVAHWLAGNPQDDYHLLVLHTHPHGTTGSPTIRSGWPRSILLDGCWSAWRRPGIMRRR